jgi:hypothetical protein
VHFSRLLCTNVTGEPWRAAGTGLRRAMCWPAGKAVICSEAGQKGPNEVFLDVQKIGCRRGKVAQWSYCMAGDSEALAGLTSTCPGWAILLHAWPHKALRDQLRRSLGAWVRHRGRSGTLGTVGDLERTVEISWQACRNR